MALFPPAPIRTVAMNVKEDTRGVPVAFFYRPWTEWFSAVTSAFNGVSRRVASGAWTTHGASIAASTLAEKLEAGVYHLGVCLVLSRAASVSSSISVPISWTSGGIARTLTALITSNLTSTLQSQYIVIRVDADSSVTYTATYASSGATTMQYALDIVLEKAP
jgi:hypothetical protein